jgi:hypothetical protein
MSARLDGPSQMPSKLRMRFFDVLDGLVNAIVDRLARAFGWAMAGSAAREQLPPYDFALTRQRILASQVMIGLGFVELQRKVLQASAIARDGRSIKLRINAFERMDGSASTDIVSGSPACASVLEEQIQYVNRPSRIREQLSQVAHAFEIAHAGTATSIAQLPEIPLLLKLLAGARHRRWRHVDCRSSALEAYRSSDSHGRSLAGVRCG